LGGQYLRLAFFQQRRPSFLITLHGNIFFLIFGESMIKEYRPVSHNKNKRDVEGSESCGKVG
jgi:hypothetical protein